MREDMLVVVENETLLRAALGEFLPARGNRPFYNLRLSEPEM